MAAPVIWFGSWLLSLMTYFLGWLRMRLVSRDVLVGQRFVVWEIKKDPKRALAHRPNLDGI
jgi:hypothetical protein